MGFQSQVGQIGIKSQTTPDVYDDPGTNQGIFLRHLSGSIQANRELIQPDPEIGGNRDTPGAVLGAVSWAGEIEAYSRFEYLPTMLYGLSGPGSASSAFVGTTQGVDLVGTHTIIPSDSELGLPQMSIEEDIAGLDTFRYFNAVVNSLSMEVEPNGYMMTTMGLLAPNQEAGITKTATPEVDTTPLSVGTSTVVTIGGVASAICVRSWSMEFNNNVEDDVFCLGKEGLTDLTPKRRDFSMSMTVRPTDNTLWREAVYGAAAATTAQSGAAATKDIVVNTKTFATVGTGTAVVFEFDINVPVTHIRPFPHEPSGDDVIEWDMEFLAVRPDNTVPLVTFTVVNDIATIR